MMLEGMRILSFVHGLYGCSASQIMADLGAEVVRVEWDSSGRLRPGSDLDHDLFFQLTGRNQKSVFIDPNTVEGIAVVHSLLQRYDIVLENCPAGLLSGWRMDYDTLREVCPRLIWCSCTAYGDSGRGEGGNDKVRNCNGDSDDELLLEAASGLASLNGPGSVPPVPAGAALIEQHAAVLMALGIIAAAYEREQSGRGHKIETDLLSASLDMQIETIGYYLNGGRFIPRVDTGLSTRIHQSPYGIYSTADGYIALSLTHHDRLSRIFSPGSMAGFTEQDAMDRREEFDIAVKQEMGKRTTAEWMKIFEGLEDMWFAPVNEYTQVMEDEQIIYNRPFVTAQDIYGRQVQALGHANCYDGKRPGVRSAPPVPGQDTEEVLSQLGYSRLDLDGLERRGVIRRGE